MLDDSNLLQFAPPIPLVGPQAVYGFGAMEIQVGWQYQSNLMIGTALINVAIGGTEGDVITSASRMIDIVNAGGGDDLVMITGGNGNLSIVTLGLGADTVMVQDNPAGFQRLTITDFRTREGDTLLVSQHFDGFDGAPPVDYVLDAFQALKNVGYVDGNDLVGLIGYNEIRLVGLAHEFVPPEYHDGKG